MDFTGLTFIGLVTIGFVNVLTFFKPDLDSQMKFGVAVLVAFILTFVPQEIGIVMFDKLKLAIEVAFASSGAYKIATKAGGN